MALTPRRSIEVLAASVDAGVLVSVPGIGGLHAALHEGGEGPAVLLLHGFTGCGRTMLPAAEAIVDHRLLFVDLPGHGRSSAPLATEAYRLEATVGGLCAVLDAHGETAVHVVGYSLGARVALGIGCLAPERVRSLVLVGGRAGIADPAARASRRADDERLAERIEARGIAAFVDDWMALPLFASQARLGPAALARARAERLENRPHGLAGSLRGLGAGAQPPLFDRLATLERPVLLVTGEEDSRFTEVADDLARQLPQASHATVAAAGHAAHLEQPAAFGALLRRFLQRSDAGHTVRGPASFAPGQHQ